VVKLDHFTLPVADAQHSRDFYTRCFGFRVEFEVAERKTIALCDDGGITLFLVTDPRRARFPYCALTLQVDDVEAKYVELRGDGIVFEKEPQKLDWGYGAEVRDPDGYLLMLWDERTMREKG
jgi:catechol 2,3-dioxygenase-like lactoylglutathione lyase family enzyme